MTLLIGCYLATQFIAVAKYAGFRKPHLNHTLVLRLAVVLSFPVIQMPSRLSRVYLIS